MPKKIFCFIYDEENNIVRVEESDLLVPTPKMYTLEVCVGGHYRVKKTEVDTLKRNNGCYIMYTFDDSTENIKQFVREVKEEIKKLITMNEHIIKKLKNKALALVNYEVNREIQMENNY